MKQMMDLMAKYSNPGDHHKILATMVGTWKAHVKMYMSPNSKPMEYDGESVRELTFGGRYLKDRFQSETQMGQLVSEGFIGYDNFKQKYTLVKMLNMGTAMITALGEMSEDGKAITFTGKIDEPMAGKKDKDAKYVYKFIDDKTMMLEIWDMVPGNPFMTIEYTYTKQ
jgi:hypothetical protein